MKNARQTVVGMALALALMLCLMPGPGALGEEWEWIPYTHPVHGYQINYPAVWEIFDEENALAVGYDDGSMLCMVIPLDMGAPISLQSIAEILCPSFVEEYGTEAAGVSAMTVGEIRQAGDRLYALNTVSVPAEELRMLHNEALIVEGTTLYIFKVSLYVYEELGDENTKIIADYITENLVSGFVPGSK